MGRNDNLRHAPFYDGSAVFVPDEARKAFLIMRAFVPAHGKNDAAHQSMA